MVGVHTHPQRGVKAVWCGEPKKAARLRDGGMEGRDGGMEVGQRREVWEWGIQMRVRP